MSGLESGSRRLFSSPNPSQRKCFPCQKLKRDWRRFRPKLALVSCSSCHHGHSGQWPSRHTDTSWHVISSYKYFDFFFLQTLSSCCHISRRPDTFYIHPTVWSFWPPSCRLAQVLKPPWLSFNVLLQKFSRDSRRVCDVMMMCAMFRCCHVNHKPHQAAGKGINCIYFALLFLWRLAEANLNPEIISPMVGSWYNLLGSVGHGLIFHPLVWIRGANCWCRTRCGKYPPASLCDLSTPLPPGGSRRKNADRGPHTVCHVSH